MPPRQLTHCHTLRHHALPPHNATTTYRPAHSATVHLPPRTAMVMQPLPTFWASETARVIVPSCFLAPFRKMIRARSLIGHLENVLLPSVPPPKSPPLLHLHRWRILLSSLETLLGHPLCTQRALLYFTRTGQGYRCRAWRHSWGHPLRTRRAILYLPHRWRIPLSNHRKVFEPRGGNYNRS